jgi:hypothetical protein
VIVKWKLGTGFRTSFRKSGLERGEYEVQQALQQKMETVYFRMLSLIYLMEKKMIVDSKVSLTLMKNTSMKRMMIKVGYLKEHVNL